MPINLPEAGLDRYINNPDNADFLQRATDLFSLATGITTLPQDALEVRIVSNAIYQMAWFLMEDHNNREAYMSNFSSERIGSYSYSKGGSSKDENNMYGRVPTFDFAVEYFANKNNKDKSLVTSEHVFEQGYVSTDADKAQRESLPLERTVPPYPAEEVEEGIWVVPTAPLKKIGDGVWSV